MLCTTYPRDKTDISSIFLKTLYQSIADRNSECELQIVTSNDSSHSENNSSYGNNLSILRFNYFLRKYQKLTYGDAVMSNIHAKPLLKLLVPFFILSMFVSGFRSMIKFKPDIVHAHWAIPSGLVGVFFKFLFRKPLLVTSHGGDVYGFQHGLRKLLLQFVYKHADCINTVSDALRVEVEAICKTDSSSKIWVQSMGVDMTQFAYVSGAKELVKFENYKYLILFVGRLSEVKGVHNLISALLKLIDLDWECWIIGEGNLKNSLIDSISQNNLSHRIKLLGKKPNPELKLFYSASDVLVIPSVPAIGGQEGLPITLMEGLQCRCNIVASALGGMKDMVNYEQITLVEPGNINALSESIKRSFNMPKVSSKYFDSNFDVKSVGLNYIKCYNRIVKSKT